MSTNKPRHDTGWLKAEISSLDSVEMGRTSYRQAITDAEALWSEWLHDEYADMLNGSQHRLVYAKAWEDGHASGYQEVEMHYQDLVDFAVKMNAVSAVK